MYKIKLGLPQWLNGKENACNAEDLGSIPVLPRFPGEGHGNPLQHSCLGNPVDRQAWWATVHEVARDLRLHGVDLPTKHHHHV